MSITSLNSNDIQDDLPQLAQDVRARNRDLGDFSGSLHEAMRFSIGDISNQTIRTGIQTSSSSMERDTISMVTNGATSAVKNAEETAKTAWR